MYYLTDWSAITASSLFMLFEQWSYVYKLSIAMFLQLYFRKIVLLVFNCGAKGPCDNDVEKGFMMIWANL